LKEFRIQRLYKATLLTPAMFDFGLQLVKNDSSGSLNAVDTYNHLNQQRVGQTQAEKTPLSRCPS